MTDYAADVRKLLDDATLLPDGPAKVAVLEEAVALADAHQNEPLALEARKELLWPAYHSDRSDLVLVHFAWCLGHADRHPDESPVDLLWRYRWVIDSMPQFPEIPRDQIDAALADMTRRYAAAGFSLRPVYLLKRSVGKALGDRAMATEANRRWAKQPRDWMSDDPETEAAFTVYHRAFLRRDADTVAAGEPFLDARFRDSHFLIGVYATLLLPLARLGRWDDAAAVQKRGARLLHARPLFAGRGMNHVFYLAVVGNLAGACRMFDRYFSPVIVEPGRLGRFGFCRAGLFLCDRLLAAGKSRTTLKVPAGLIPAAPDGRCPVPALRAWLDAETRDMAAVGDARNGNTHYFDELSRLAELHKLADKHTASEETP